MADKLSHHESTHMQRLCIIVFLPISWGQSDVEDGEDSYEHFELKRDAHLTKTCIRLVMSARNRGLITKRGNGRTLGPSPFLPPGFSNQN